MNFELSGAQVNRETVKAFADKVAHEVRERVAHLRTRNVFIPFGGEGMFRNAEQQFKNMDRLMAYVAAQPNTGVALALTRILTITVSLRTQ